MVLLINDCNKYKVLYKYIFCGSIKQKSNEVQKYCIGNGFKILANKFESNVILALLFSYSNLKLNFLHRLISK